MDLNTTTNTHQGVTNTKWRKISIVSETQAYVHDDPEEVGSGELHINGRQWISPREIYLVALFEMGGLSTTGHLALLLVL